MYDLTPGCQVAQFEGLVELLLVADVEQALGGVDDALERLVDNPVVTLNRAVAVAMVHGPEHGLALVERIATDQRLARTHPVEAVRAAGGAITYTFLAALALHTLARTRHT